MKLSKDQQKIKTSLLKAISMVRNEQGLQTMKTIADIPSLNKLPEVAKLKEKLSSGEEKTVETSLKQKTETRPVNRITHCIQPPYTMGTSLNYGHPTRVPSGERIVNLFNPFSFVNYYTGEISLADIAGQNNSVYYGAGVSFLGGSFGYYKPACGTIHQLIELPVAFDYDTLVEISVSAQLPSTYNNVVKLLPDVNSTVLSGLVGAEGFIEAYVSYTDEGHNAATTSTSNKFLEKWQTAVPGSERGYYHNTSVCNHSFILPAGVSIFYIHVNAHINAHCIANAMAGVHTNTYSLIDFRETRFQDDIPITLPDHTAHGPIRITNICYSIEPYYVDALPPDTH